MDNKKNIDVSPPGNQPADQTSRPIIVSRDQAAHDPMVRSKDLTSSQRSEPMRSAVAAKPSSNPETSPLSTPTASAQPAAGTEPTTQSQASKTDSSSADSELPSSVIDSKQPETAAEIPDDKVQTLINSKTYNLPIKASKTKRAFMIIAIILFLVIMLGAVATYILMS